MRTIFVVGYKGGPCLFFLDRCRLKLRKWITTYFIGNEARLLSLFPCAYGRINIYLCLYRPFRVLCFYTKTIIASDAYSTVMIIPNTAL